MPMTSLLDYVDEDQVKVFLEKMTAEEIDLQAFLTNAPFKLACTKGQWKGAFTLHALGYCQSEGHQGKEIDQMPPMEVEARRAARLFEGLQHVAQVRGVFPPRMTRILGFRAVQLWQGIQGK